MTDAGVPEAWPALLSREQLRAYLGGICDATLRKVCPVPPIELGANVLRYRKLDVDRWLDGRPARTLRIVETAGQDAPPANPRPMTAAEKARARVGKR